MRLRFDRQSYGTEFTFASSYDGSRSRRGKPAHEPLDFFRVRRRLRVRLARFLVDLVVQDDGVHDAQVVGRGRPELGEKVVRLGVGLPDGLAILAHRLALVVDVTPARVHQHELGFGRVAVVEHLADVDPTQAHASRRGVHRRGSVAGINDVHRRIISGSHVVRQGLQQLLPGGEELVQTRGGLVVRQTLLVAYGLRPSFDVLLREVGRVAHDGVALSHPVAGFRVRARPPLVVERGLDREIHADAVAIHAERHLDVLSFVVHDIVLRDILRDILRLLRTLSFKRPGGYVPEAHGDTLADAVQRRVPRAPPRESNLPLHQQNLRPLGVLGESAPRRERQAHDSRARAQVGDPRRR
mmetsp:Transcript_13793/g.55820  ORF Transcript_13793/g.55820 Transcript_13793/m.55820 type:complete len:355 (-) Transcript_13793:734-1798(-)